MNELRKFLFGQGGSLRHCIKNCTSNKEVVQRSYSTQKLLTQRLRSQFESSLKSFTERLDILSQLLSRQCNIVIAQRIRRSYQILLLYRNLYGEQYLKDKLSSQLNKIKKKPLLAVISASFFNWDEERVTDDEIKRCFREVNAVHRLARGGQAKADGYSQKENLSEWEQVVDKEDFKVWARLIPNTQLYQYRVLGNFKDISARAFYNTQVDVAYWKDWDQQTMDVKIVDKDAKTGSEVIQWLYKFPYPMYPREYVYVRRCVVNSAAKSMIITARATEHPACPTRGSNVRMSTYTSQMVITPYRNFDENGFTYIMSYCDDPQTNFPPTWYNWLATSGVEDFLERMHQAALNKQEKAPEVPSPPPIENNTPIYPDKQKPNHHKPLKHMVEEDPGI